MTTKQQVFGLYAKYRYLLRRDRHAVGTPELVAVCEMIDEIATLEEKFDLLNCNVADRPGIIEIVQRSGHDEMLFLVSFWHAYDSTDHRGKEFIDYDTIQIMLSMHFCKEFSRMDEELRDIDPSFSSGILEMFEDRMRKA